MKRILSLVLAILMLSGLATVLSACGDSTKTYKLDDCIDVTFDGYDGYGMALIDFNDNVDKINEELTKRLQKKLKKMDEEQKIAAALLFDGGNVKVQHIVDPTLSGVTRLSNGEKLTVKLDVDNTMRAILDVDFTINRKEVSVSGLKAIGEMPKKDVLEGISVNFSGIAPNASAYITCSADADSWVSSSVKLDRENGLKLGDTVTLSIDADEETIKEHFVNKGYLPEATEKTFTVSDISSYVLSASDIDSASLDKMIAEGKDMQSAAAADWDDSLTLISTEYIGNHFLFVKDMNQTGFVSRHVSTLILVFEVKTSGGLAKSEQTFYNVIMYDDLQLLPDGKLSFSPTDYDKAYHRSKKVGYEGFILDNYVNGYDDLDSLYKDLVTDKIDQYTCVSDLQK